MMRFQGFMGIFISKANSKLFRHQFTLSGPARADANPWSTLFKACYFVLFDFQESLCF